MQELQMVIGKGCRRLQTLQMAPHVRFYRDDSRNSCRERDSRRRIEQRK
jgi:hypothetical protein